jgi:hypothetical protein
MSLVLSQNTSTAVKDLAGLHLTWTSTISAPLIEQDLIYLDTVTGNTSKLSLSPTATTASITTGLIAGRVYTFWVYAVDNTNAEYDSNIFSPSTPYALSAPTLTFLSGNNNGVTLTVKPPAMADGEILSGSPQVCFMFLEVSKGIPQVPFTINKPLIQEESNYVLSVNDNSKLSNDNVYKVSCFIKPDLADTAHTSASSISNTVNAQPSNLPGKPSVNFADNNPNGSADGTWSVSWTPPPDLPLWSQFDNKKVKVNILMKKVNDLNYPNPIVLDNPTSLTYSFPAVTPVVFSQYQVQIYYTNDNGDGARSDIQTYYNFAPSSPPSNFQAYDDPASSVVRVFFSSISNVNYLSSSNATFPYGQSIGFTIIETKDGVDTIQKIGKNNAIGDFNVQFPYTASDVGKQATYSAYYSFYNPNKTPTTLTVINGTPASKTVTIYSNPSILTNVNAVAQDSKITFTWSPPTVADGNQHTSNSAIIVLSTANFPDFSTVTGTNGSYTATGLTNGSIYSAKLYALATNPLGNPVQDTTGVSLINLKPAGLPPSVTNLRATVGDGTLTLNWDNTVGQKLNGGIISQYSIQLQGTGYNNGGNTSNNSVTYTNLTNGAPYTFTIQQFTTTGYYSQGTSLANLVPVGLPIISNIQFSGKTVSYLFNPNGSSLTFFEAIGLSASPSINDAILFQSPADITTYPSYSSSSITPFTLSITFSGIVSGDVASVIIIASTSAGTALKNTLAPN